MCRFHHVLDGLDAGVRIVGDLLAEFVFTKSPDLFANALSQFDIGITYWTKLNGEKCIKAVRLVEIPLVVTLEKRGKLLDKFVQVLGISINYTTRVKKLLANLCEQLDKYLTGSLAFSLDAEVLDSLVQRLTRLNNLKFNHTRILRDFLNLNDLLLNRRGSSRFHLGGDRLLEVI